MIAVMYQQMDIFANVRFACYWEFGKWEIKYTIDSVIII